MDEILPFLSSIPSREPAVLMSMLGIHKVTMEDSKLGITKDALASKILPFLISISVDSSLNLTQVSFTTVEFVDGGQTLVTSGGRVAPDCRGTGVFGRFIKQLLQKYLSLPAVRYLALTADNVNLEANGAKIMKTHKQILEKVLTHVEGDASAMDDSIAERTVPGVPTH